MTTTDLRVALREEAARLNERLSMIGQLLSSLGEGRDSPPPRKAPSLSTTTSERISKEGIEGALGQIVKLLEKHAEGLRSEDIRAELNMSKKLFQYAAHAGKAADRLTQTGERRSTIYSLPAAQKKNDDTSINASEILDRLNGGKGEAETPKTAASRVIRRKKRA